MSTSVPSGRFGRFAKLASLGARTGASLVLSKDGQGAAEVTARVLGEMRGLAAKVGQMASYVDGFVPDDHKSAYAVALSALQSRAVESPPEAVRALVARELGAPIDELFETFDIEPFASASIGQVHRATLADGRDVAVKVQHPGIDKAVAADLDNASVLQSMVGKLAPREMDPARVFAEIRARFEEELDYEHEAAELRAFRVIHSGDPHIVIPDVVGDRSARRVITTDLVKGMTLAEAALAPADERARYAMVLWRFVFKSLLQHGRFNADPHPGNYIFMPGGRVAFLDFGCTQVITKEHNQAALRLHRAALASDEVAFAEATRAFLGLRGGPFEETALSYVRRTFEPLFHPTFHVTPTYVASIVRGIQELKRHAMKKRSGFVPLKPGMLFMNRLQFGFYSILAKLDAEVSFRSVEEEIFSSLS